MSRKVWLIHGWCIENKQTLMAENVLSSARFINGCTKGCEKKLGEMGLSFERVKSDPGECILKIKFPTLRLVAV